MATSIYAAIIVAAILLAFAIWLVKTRNALKYGLLLCLLGLWAFVETAGTLLLLAEGIFGVGAENMNFPITLLSSLATIAVDCAFFAGVFAIQSTKVTSATYAMPVFGITALILTIITSLVHGAKLV